MIMIIQTAENMSGIQGSCFVPWLGLTCMHFASLIVPLLRKEVTFKGLVDSNLNVAETLLLLLP